MMPELNPGVPYEKITRSSRDFDQEAGRLMDFWFNGLTSWLQFGSALGLDAGPERC